MSVVLHVILRNLETQVIHFFEVRIKTNYSDLTFAIYSSHASTHARTHTHARKCVVDKSRLTCFDVEYIYGFVMLGGL